MTDVETARQRRIKERPHYEAFGQLVAARLQASLKPIGIWFHVEARAKTVDSLVKKLLTKKHHTFESLADKVGARVIIRYRDDVNKVTDKIRKAMTTDRTSGPTFRNYLGMNAMPTSRVIWEQNRGCVLSPERWLILSGSAWTNCVQEFIVQFGNRNKR